MTEKHYNDMVTQYADNVYRFVVKNIRNSEDARDIVQISFEKLWKHRDTIQPEQAKSWLFTVAYHQLIDWVRKKNRSPLTDAVPEAATTSLFEKKALQEKLHDALQQLNEVQRSLVLLKDYEGYSYEEIGTITGLHASQVKVYLHRARQTLRNILVSVEEVLN
jgi:RNA polymerase sigma-70 factor (ECF subfamily)